MGSGAGLKTKKTAHVVILNLFQHLRKSMSYETLKRVQGDKIGVFRQAQCPWLS